MTENHSKILRGSDTPLKIPKTSVGWYLFERLRSHDPYDVLMCEAESHKTVSPPEFLTLSARLTEALREAGMKQKDVACILGKASIDVYATATGVLFLGGIVFPLDHNLNPEVFELLLKTTSPKFVFCDGDIAEKVAPVLDRLGNSAPIITFGDYFEADTHYESFESFLKPNVDLNEFRPLSSANVQEEDVTFMVCSSGTTGIPKPVMITEKNVLYQIAAWRLTSYANKIFLCPAITFSYFFWISGVLLYLSAICCNYEMTIVQRLEQKHVLNLIERHKPVWGIFSPALVKFLTIDPEFKTYDVSSLVLMVTGGCSLQKVLTEKIRETWSPYMTCRQSYGATEVTGIATIGSLEDDILSVGKLLPGFQLKIVSANDGTLLGPDQEGDIYLKSPSVMKGYMQNEEATNEVLFDGWFRTGDVGYYTKTGLIYIKGRRKDFIQMDDGEWVSPTEIEDFMLSIPSVVDVGVAGVKNEDGKVLLTALVVKLKEFNMTEEDIIGIVAENMPERMRLLGGVWFVSGIPRTPSGKMKRADLQNLAESLFQGN